MPWRRSLRGPVRNTPSWSPSFLKAAIALGAEVSSSSMVHSSLRPLTPPAALASSNASTPPERLPVPQMAAGPVRLPRMPILIVLLLSPGASCAAADRLAVTSIVPATSETIFMFSSRAVRADHGPGGADDGTAGALGQPIGCYGRKYARCTSGLDRNSAAEPR